MVNTSKKKFHLKPVIFHQIELKQKLYQDVGKEGISFSMLGAGPIALSSVQARSYPFPHIPLPLSKYVFRWNFHKWV